MTLVIVAAIAAWIAFGAGVGLRESRRGHWRWLWLLGAIAGPFAIPLARETRWRERSVRPLVLAEGEPGGGEVRVLAGIDGSTTAVDAISATLGLLGPALGEATLAVVVDYELATADPQAGSTEDPWEEMTEAKEAVAAAADAVGERTGFRPGTVVLGGNPASALATHASEAGHDLIVVATRGHGMTKRLLGSCADQLVRTSPVPVFVVTPGEGHEPSTGQPDARVGRLASQ